MRGNKRGQTLVEGVASLSLLFLIFICVYYIFLLGLDKIRSLDTAYHLARVQQVKEDNNAFVGKASLVIWQCFGRLSTYQLRALPAGNAVRTAEISFEYFPNFMSTLLMPRAHKSLMRVAQPETKFLSRSYPAAAVDDGGPSLAADLTKDQIVLQALAHAGGDAVVDALEDIEASRQAGQP